MVVALLMEEGDLSFFLLLFLCFFSHSGSHLGVAEFSLSMGLWSLDLYPVMYSFLDGGGGRGRASLVCVCVCVSEEVHSMQCQTARCRHLPLCPFWSCSMEEQISKESGPGLPGPVLFFNWMKIKIFVTYFFKLLNGVFHTKALY